MSDVELRPPTIGTARASTWNGARDSTGDTATTDDPAASSAATGSGSESDARLLLARLWETHRATNEARVTLLEAVTADLVVGGAGSFRARRDDARIAAHQLAGSLGTFGFQHGTDAARAAEAELEQPHPDPHRLSVAVDELRSCIEGAILDVPDEPAASDGCADAADLASAAAGGDDPADGPVEHGSHRARVALITTDHPFAATLELEAAAAAIDLVVVAPDGPGGPMLASSALVLLDETALVPDDVDEELVRELAAHDVVVLGDEDDLPSRLDAAERGAVGYVARATRPRSILTFVSRKVADRRQRRISVWLVTDRPNRAASWDLERVDPDLEVTEIPDDLEALGEALSRGRPDLLLIDDSLQQLDAWILGRVVRGNPSWRFLPMMAVISSFATEERMEAFRAGIDDVVRTGVDADEMSGRIRALVRLARRGREGEERDPTTGLLNRRYAEVDLERLVARSETNASPAVVALVSVSEVGALREAVGDASTELLLQEAGSALLRSFRGDDVVGRWDDRTFVVGLHDVGVERATERLEYVRQRLKSLAKGLASRVEVPVSIGLATCPGDGANAPKLLRRAAARLRDAEAHGGVLLGQSKIGDVTTVDVLVVDDDPSVADVMELAMHQRGLTTERASDGVTAVNALVTGAVRARLVLLDIGLPGLDGFGVLQALRANGVLRHTKVIVVTARSSESETLRALGLGAVDHLAKPFSVPILVQRVRATLTT